jgi:rhodanese-related sulfurtransferase
MTLAKRRRLVSDPPRPDREPGDPLLRAIAVHWAEIRALASDEQWERVRALVAGTAESDAREAYAALADELGDILPPDHEISVMMRTGVMSGTATDAATADAQMLEELWLLSDLVLDPGESAWRAAHGDTDLPVFDPPGTAFGAATDFDRLVEARLLSLPALTPDDARQRGVDPDDARLIRLPRPGAAPDFQLPAFQFAPTGGAWDIVMEVNQVLDAADDPWGVMCWWVDPHARFGDAPADLLGHGQDGLIRRAARAVVEDY